MSSSDEFFADLAACYDDPLRFVLWAFPWGTTPELSLVTLKEPWASRYPGCKYGPDKWACEVLDYVGEQVRANAFDGVHAVKPIQVAVASGHGIGKALDDELVVDTPKGKCRWGDLKIGDSLWGPDGRPTHVVAIPFRGKTPCYKVTFSDGPSTVCSSGHLWTVLDRRYVFNNKKEKWVTLTTQDIFEEGVRFKKGKVARWALPRVKAVEYPQVTLPIHPYALGVWLGDGTKNGAEFVTCDSDIVEHLREVGVTVTKINGSVRKGCKASKYYFTGCRTAFRTLDVFGKGSQDKYIPDIYKFASIEQRSELLRGLIDTDGEVDLPRTVIYSSNSKRLIEDICWLARSLGGKAHVHETVKQAFRYVNGVRQNNALSYRCTLTMPHGFKVAYVKRKQERLDKAKKMREGCYRRTIASVEPVPERVCTCVTVDRPDGLFLANDFIVTHNSALTAWLTIWVMATRPGAKGAVTANTASQLETKTFAEISKWLKRSIVRDMFDIKASSVVQKDEPESWRVDALTCREENSEAFAGQHAASSSSFYIFDEASAVPDAIWSVAEGGLTDGEPLWFVFGNPTRNTGRFKECFGRFRNLWHTFQIDSRDVQVTNKEQIAVWAKEYGEDSDFFRVRVRGQFPNASTTQFIPTKLAEDAMARPAPARHHIATAIVGVDVARFGDDDTVIVTRFGKDATTPFARYHGLGGDRVIALVKAKINELYREGFERVYVFLDEGGLGGAIVDVLRADGFREVRGVNFGQGADDPELYPFKREEMWARMKKWLEFGSIPNDQQLLDDLTGIEFEYDLKGRPKLESKADMKKRGLHSPDAADALALTWAYQVREVSDRTVGPERVRGGADAPRKFDPFDLKFCTRR